jgi:hypothetical protein
MVVVPMFAVVVVAPVVVVQPVSEAAGTEYYYEVTDMEKISPQTNFTIIKSNTQTHENNQTTWTSYLDFLHLHHFLLPVFRIRIQIQMWIHMFLGLPDPDPAPLVRGMDQDLSVIKQK